MKNNQSPTVKRTAPVSKKDIQRSSTSKMLQELKGLLDNPILLNGCDKHILGYDLQTSEVIYDGYGIINQFADQLLSQDKKDNEPIKEWEEYYDSAYEYVCNGLIDSTSLNSFRNGKWVDLNAGKPKPRILMYLLK